MLSDLPHYFGLNVDGWSVAYFVPLNRAFHHAIAHLGYCQKRDPLILKFEGRQFFHDELPARQYN